MFWKWTIINKDELEKLKKQITAKEIVNHSLNQLLKAERGINCLNDYIHLEHIPEFNLAMILLLLDDIDICKINTSDMRSAIKDELNRRKRERK